METKLSENLRPLFVSWRIDPFTPKKPQKVCFGGPDFIVDEYFDMHLTDLKMIVSDIQMFLTTGNEEYHQGVLQRAKKIEALIERMGRNADYKNYFNNL